MSDSSDTPPVATDQAFNEENKLERQVTIHSDFPEGGLRAWLVVGAASTIMALSFGMVNSFGVYQTYYEHRYPNVSSTNISVIGSIQAAFTFIFGLPSTICMYYVGPQVMVGIGVLLCTLSFMFLSISNAVWQLFVIQGVMFGMGSGIMYIHATTVLFQYFNKRKALVQGIITAGASVAGVYWPIAVRELISRVGFGWANRIIGFMYLPMGVFAVGFLVPRIRPPKRQPGQNFLRVNFGVLRQWKLWLLAFEWFCWMFSMFPGLFYIDLFCQRTHVAEPLQKYNVAIVNGVACFARVIPGYFADRFGRMNIDIIFLVASGILPLALWTQARSTGAVLAFCITWGVASGAPVSVTPAIVGQIFPARDIPSCLSFFFFCGGLGSLAGPSLAGLFIPKGHVDTAAGFNRLAIFVGIVALVCAGMIVFLRTNFTRRVLAKM